MQCSGNHRKSCTCMVGSLESPAGSTWTFFLRKDQEKVWNSGSNPKSAQFFPFSSQTSSFLSILIPNQLLSLLSHPNQLILATLIRWKTQISPD